MIIATAPFIAAQRVVETKGQVFGLVVRSRGLGGNIMAGLRSLGGGEIHEYTSLLEDTRRQAIDRMVQNATLMGANAVISMRFDSSELAGTMSEIVAYGTAVVVAPDAGTRRQPMTEPGGTSMVPRRPLLVLGLGGLLILAGLAIVAATPSAVGSARCWRSFRVAWSSSRSSWSGALPLRGGRTAQASRPGPGGGEPAADAEPRFRPTDELSSIRRGSHDARLRRPARPANGATVAEG